MGEGGREMGEWLTVCLILGLYAYTPYRKQLKEAETMY